MFSNEELLIQKINLLSKKYKWYTSLKNNEYFAKSIIYLNKDKYNYFLNENWIKIHWSKFLIKYIEIKPTIQEEFIASDGKTYIKEIKDINFLNKDVRKKVGSQFWRFPKYIIDRIELLSSEIDLLFKKINWNIKSSNDQNTWKFASISNIKNIMNQNFQIIIYIINNYKNIKNEIYPYSLKTIIISLNQIIECFKLKSNSASIQERLNLSINNDIQNFGDLIGFIRNIVIHPWEYQNKKVKELKEKNLINKDLIFLEELDIGSFHIKGNLFNKNFFNEENIFFDFKKINTISEFQNSFYLFLARNYSIKKKDKIKKIEIFYALNILELLDIFCFYFINWINPIRQ